MWPWGHAGVGYLLLVGVVLVWRIRFPTRWEVAVTLLATQLPDLIDKPLAWLLPVLPSARSLGHSLLSMALLVLLLVVVLRRYSLPRDRDLPATQASVVIAFAVGYGSHLLTDAPGPALSPNLSEATYLLWPLLPAPTYETTPTLASTLRALESWSLQGPELATAAVAVAHLGAAVRRGRIVDSSV